MKIGKRILIAGISGVDIQNALNKFVSYSRLKGEHFEDPLCINDYIHEIERHKDSTITILDILAYPYPILHKLWSQAFKIIEQKINDKPSKNHILVIHS